MKTAKNSSHIIPFYFYLSKFLAALELGHVTDFDMLFSRDENALSRDGNALFT